MVAITSAHTRSLWVVVLCISDRLGFGQLGQFDLSAVNRAEVVKQRLDGLHSRVVAVVVCDLSREGLGDASR